VAGSCGHAPFFNSSFRAYDNDNTGLHKGVGFKQRERDDSCVFCNFLCFGGCLVNCFSSNTSCTCLDSVIGRSSYSVFFYVYPLFFSHIFCDLGLSSYIFPHLMDSVIQRFSYSELVCTLYVFRIP